jgi:hypothetical protein
VKELGYIDLIGFSDGLVKTAILFKTPDPETFIIAGRSKQSEYRRTAVNIGSASFTIHALWPSLFWTRLLDDLEVNQEKGGI